MAGLRRKHPERPGAVKASSSEVVDLGRIAPGRWGDSPHPGAAIRSTPAESIAPPQVNERKKSAGGG